MGLRHSTQILKPISRSRISNPEKESYLFLKCEDEKMSDKPAAPKHTKEAEELAQGKAKNVKVKNIRLRAIYSYDAKMAGTIFFFKLSYFSSRDRGNVSNDS